MTTIEEMVEDALVKLYEHSTTPWGATAYWDEWTRKKPREAMRRALLAVIDKHVGPMLAEAHCAGQRDMADGGFYENHAHAHAARILAQLKGPTP